MVGIELLIGPLRALVAALGTGVLPPGNPAERVRMSTTTVDSARQRSLAASNTVQTGWQGRGAEAATDTTDAMARRMTTLADDGEQFARLVEDAGRTVHRAAVQLDGLIDSFERRAHALRSALFTPSGLLAILPVAIDHVGRGVEVVARTRHELSDDTAAMTELARRLAPGTAPAPDAAVPAGGPTTPQEGGVAITLPDGSTAYAPNERAAKAVRAALSQRGVPYLWGGTTPAGFDCSGFTQWAYRQAGLDIPRLAQDQDTAGFPVSQAQLQPGDLAVWSGHVAMYIGNGQLVEAGDPVGVSPVRTTNLGQTFEGFFRPR